MKLHCIAMGAPWLLHSAAALATAVNFQGYPGDAVLVAQTPTTETLRSQGYDFTVTVDRQYGSPDLRGAPHGIPAQWFVDVLAPI